MEGMSGKVVSSEEDEGGGSLKIILPHKPHRKLLSGIKIFKTVKAKTGDSPSDPWMRRGNDEVVNGEEFFELQRLPLDLITHHILTRFSIKTLLQFKSVSKEWYSTISSYEFANLHLKFSLSRCHPSSPIECLFIQAENNFYLFYYKEDDQKLDYHFVKLETNFDDQQHKDELHLVGSCNGLVCLANSSSATIWNPVTHHWCKVSDPHILSFNYKTSWGFAHVSSVDDYKVVRVVQNCSTLEIVVHVCSLRTRKWKRVSDHGLDHNLSLTKTDPGVLVDETLYWLMDTNDPKRKIVIMGFDFNLEKFDNISGLFPRSVTPWDQFLCVMGGRLSLCGLNMHKEVYVVILKRPGEVETVYFAPDLGLVRLWSGLVGFTTSDRFFIMSKNGELALVDPNSTPKEQIPLITFREGCGLGMVRFNPGLISPFAISENPD